MRFNPFATQAIVQQLVRAITFKTVGGPASQRAIVFTVSDGDGGLSDEDEASERDLEQRLVTPFFSAFGT